MIGASRRSTLIAVLSVLRGRPDPDVPDHRRLGRARGASTPRFKFFLYTLLGSVLMLLAIMAMYWQRRHDRHPDADARTSFPPDMQTWLWLAFFASFAVKMPMWPVHTWLPDAHVEAPTAGSVILAGILLKMGGYGFLRFSLPMFPLRRAELRAARSSRLSVIAIVYTSLVALGAGGHEEADRLLVGGAHGLRDHGHLRLQPRRASDGAHLPDAVARASSPARSSSASAWSTTACTRARSTPMAASSTACRCYAAVFMVFTMANVGLPGTVGLRRRIPDA